VIGGLKMKGKPEQAKTTIHVLLIISILFILGSGGSGILLIILSFELLISIKKCKQLEKLQQLKKTQTHKFQNELNQ
jgi:hypothetical protein